MTLCPFLGRVREEKPVPPTEVDVCLSRAGCRKRVFEKVGAILGTAFAPTCQSSAQQENMAIKSHR